MSRSLTEGVAAATERRVGFYGKLPMRGDFLSRFLPHDFIAPWDEWLQHSITVSRDQLGEAWLPVYLSAPIWRFVLTAGACGAAPAIGVMMPSVDRVGRYFPLAIVCRPERCAAPLRLLESAAPWFAALEQLALATLEDAADLDAFERGVMALAPPPEPDGAGALSHPQGSALAVPAGEDAIRAAMPALIDGFLADPGRRSTLWWTSGSEAMAPCLVAAAGLPPPDGFAALLDGKWERWGWKNR